jgi:DNA polymerase-3 subunit delta'
VLTDVAGQEDGVRFLRRVASREFTSPLLLVGDEGVGRRFAVLQLVKEIFCMRERAGDCKCHACAQVDEGVHVDLVSVAPENADKDIGVEQIRTIVEESDAYPSIAPLKIFVIDGVDRMTPAAANAFLKTLEEPPDTTRFLVLAEDESRVIPTIRSRCGRVRFRRLPESFVVSTIQRFESDPTKALVYARMAEGSVGRAIRFWGSGRLGLRDRIISLLSACVQGDLPSVFSIVSSLDKELPLGLRLLDQLLHDLLMLKHEPSRMIHVDAVEPLSSIRQKLSDEVWLKLSSGLKVLNARSRGTRINLTFHVQSLFTDTIVGV